MKTSPPALFDTAPHLHTWGFPASMPALSGKWNEKSASSPIPAQDAALAKGLKGIGWKVGSKSDPLRHKNKQGLSTWYSWKVGSKSDPLRLNQNISLNFNSVGKLGRSQTRYDS